MPMVDIQVIEGVFSPAEKQEMIEKVTNTMVEIEGENLRDLTWVRIIEIASGDWGIAGNGVTAEAVQGMRNAKAA